MVKVKYKIIKEGKKNIPITVKNQCPQCQAYYGPIPVNKVKEKDVHKCGRCEAEYKISIEE